MGNSLQDQLLKAGLVNKKQVNKNKKAKHQKIKQNYNAKNITADPNKQALEKAKAEKIIKDRELNKEKHKQTELKAVEAQINQLIKNNQQDYGGDEVYQFQDGELIKRIYVSQLIQAQLLNGALQIIRYLNDYAVVPANIAEKIKKRAASRVIVTADKQSQDVDSDYAAYKVPDDLQW